MCFCVNIYVHMCMGLFISKYFHFSVILIKYWEIIFYAKPSPIIMNSYKYEDNNISERNNQFFDEVFAIGETSQHVSTNENIPLVCILNYDRTFHLISLLYVCS